MGSFRICDGNPFHSLGAAAKKTRSPNVKKRDEKPLITINNQNSKDYFSSMYNSVDAQCFAQCSSATIRLVVIDNSKLMRPAICSGEEHGLIS